jgi:uncharacterized protein (TIGR02246 family)
MSAKRLTTVGVLLSTIATVGLTAGAWGQPTQEPVRAEAGRLSEEDDRAVRKVVAGIEAAWNAHDMKAYGKLLRDDVEWVNVVGMHWRGRDAVMKAHAAFHETSFKNHTIKTDTVELRSLGGGHAVAVVTTTNDPFTTPAGDVVPKRQNRLTYLMTKGSDGWKIAHAHNVPVDADAARFNPVREPGK